MPDEGSAYAWLRNCTHNTRWPYEHRALKSQLNLNRGWIHFEFNNNCLLIAQCSTQCLRMEDNQHNFKKKLVYTKGCNSFSESNWSIFHKNIKKIMERATLKNGKKLNSVYPDALPSNPIPISASVPRILTRQRPGSYYKKARWYLINIVLLPLLSQLLWQVFFSFFLPQFSSPFYISWIFCFCFFFIHVHNNLFHFMKLIIHLLPLQVLPDSPGTFNKFEIKYCISDWTQHDYEAQESHPVWSK